MVQNRQLYRFRSTTYTLAMLSFSRPLLLLLLLLAPLAWWLLRRPRRGLALMTFRLGLWQRAARELGLLQPKRSHWVDLPLVMALAALALVAAGPRWGAGDGPRVLLVLLDRSPSMSAPAAGGQSRYAAARSRLSQLATGLPPLAEVRVVAAGGGKLLRGGGLAGESETWLGEIRGWGTASSRPARLADICAGMRLTGYPLVVLSDFAGPERDVPEIAGDIRFHGFGKDIPNGRLLDFDPGESWPAEQICAQVSMAGVAAGGKLALYTDHGHRPLQIKDVPPGSNTVELKWPRSAGRVRLVLEPHDDYPLDDTLVFVPLPAPALKVALWSMGKPTGLARSLAHALASGAGKLVGRKEADLVILDRGKIGKVPALTSQDWLLLGTEVSGLTTGKRHHHPLIGIQDIEHPLLVGLDFSQVGIEESLAVVSLPGELQAILRDQQGRPLIITGQARHRLAHLLFDPARSSLPGELLLPRLVHRLLKWYGPLNQPQPRPCRPGGGLPHPLESEIKPGPAPSPSPLPRFFRPGQSIAPWLLCLALVGMVLWLAFARQEHPGQPGSTG